MLQAMYPKLVDHMNANHWPRGNIGCKTGAKLHYVWSASSENLLTLEKTLRNLVTIPPPTLPDGPL